MERIGVFCNDCDSLLKEFMSIREMNPHETTVLVGLDDGQGLLKVCMTVQENKLLMLIVSFILRFFGKLPDS